MATYYVNTTGGGTGASEASAMSLANAISTAVAGDTVWVKSGNYGNLLLIQNNDGTALNNITFIGYTITIGDIVSDEGSTFTRTDSLNSAIMPLIQGVQTAQSRGQGTGITINGDHVVFENFQFRYQNTAVYITGQHSEAKNIVTDLIGDFSGDDGSGFDDYDGYGIRLSGTYSKATNCLIKNCGAEGIHMRDAGNYCIVDWCEVFCDNSVNPTDYYILSSGTHHNIITNSTSYRSNGLDHFGHGLLNKFSAHHNTYLNCKVVGTGIESTFGSNNNLYKNIEVTGWWDSLGNNAGGGINFGKGVFSETLENIRISNHWLGVSFASWDESGDGAVSNASSDCVFKNLVIFNCDFAIAGNEFQNNGRPASGHKFYNLTISDISNRLFRLNRPLNGFEIYDSIIHNCNGLQVTSGGFGFTLDTGTSFSRCNVSGSGINSATLSPYITNNITSLSPPFTNSAAGDFTLTSDILNIGEYHEDNPLDYFGRERSVYTLGAYSFGDAEPEPVPDITQKVKYNCSFFNLS